MKEIELATRATTYFLNMAKDLTTTSEERRLQTPEKVHAEERRSGCRVERGNLIFCVRSRTIEYFEDALVSRTREAVSL